MFICFTPQNKHFFQTLVGPRIAILLHLSFNWPFPEEVACSEVGQGFLHREGSVEAQMEQNVWALWKNASWTPLKVTEVNHFFCVCDRYSSEYAHFYFFRHHMTTFIQLWDLNAGLYWEAAILCCQQIIFSIGTNDWHQWYRYLCEWYLVLLMLAGIQVKFH